MAWANGRAGSNIPKAVRLAVRERDCDQCQLRYPGCTVAYEQLDHIRNLAARGVDRRHDRPTVDDLQCVCRSCHRWKTADEARASRRARVRTAVVKHPGLLW